MPHRTPADGVGAVSVIHYAGGLKENDLDISVAQHINPQGADRAVGDVVSVTHNNRGNIGYRECCGRPGGKAERCGVCREVVVGVSGRSIVVNNVDVRDRGSARVRHGVGVDYRSFHGPVRRTGRFHQSQAGWCRCAWGRRLHDGELDREITAGIRRRHGEDNGNDIAALRLPDGRVGQSVLSDFADDVRVINQSGITCILVVGIGRKRSADNIPDGGLNVPVSCSAGLVVEDIIELVPLRGTRIGVR